MIDMAEAVTSSSAALAGAEKILNQPLDQINKAFCESMFAAYFDKETGKKMEAPFSPQMKIILKPEQYKYIKAPIKTDLGRLLVNRYMLERTGFIEIIGYYNGCLNEDGLGGLNAKINNAVLTDQQTTKALGEYIDARDHLGFWVTSYLGCSITPALIRPMHDVRKRKSELFKQREADLKSDNPVTQIKASNEIEKELLKMTTDNLKKDDGWDMYASGINNMSNNYKTINVMVNPVFNNITKKYDIIESSLMDGINQRDITGFANSVVAAAYPSAVGTAEAGAMAKIILALLQSEHIDPNPESDCGTKSTIPVTIQKKYKKYFLFRNFNINGKMVSSNLDNIDQFVGKTVQMYSPMCCKNQAICAKCAGKVYHNLQAENVGLLSTQITQKLLNLKLKAKHNLSQSAGDIPKETIFWHDNNEIEVKDSNLYTKSHMKLFIPRVLEELKGFYREATTVSSMAMFPVKFYDKSGNVKLSTMMTVPGMLSFNIYEDIQEDENYYILSYEPDSLVCNLGIQTTFVNVEFFINQVFLYAKSPQVPYKLMPEMFFRCQQINSTDLTGPCITYELLARRVCRDPSSPNRSFAYVYGNDPNCNQLGYVKQPYRTAVHESGVLEGILFQDSSKAISIGLARTLNGKKSEQTPLEKIIKA